MSYISDKLAFLRSYKETGVQRAPLDLDHEELPVLTCLNCGTQFRGSYCPHCGQKSSTGRLNWKTALTHIVNNFTNLENGFLRTCLDLFYRPGYLIRDYIRGRRTDYSKPLQMLFVLATLHVIVHYIFFQTSGFHPGDVMNDLEGIEEEQLQQAYTLLKQVLNYFATNQAAVTLLFALMMVFPNWLFFKLTAFGKKLNIVEHFYAMLFVGCQLMILNILEIPYIRMLGGVESMTSFSSFYTFFIAVWDFKQLCQIKYRKSFWLLAGSSFLAFIIFLIIIILIVFAYIFFHPELMNKYIIAD